MKHYWQVILGIAIVLILGFYAGQVWAQSNAETIQVCVAKNGYFRLTQSQDKCKKGETYLIWNIQGVPGPEGPQGPQGEPGVGSIRNSPELCINCYIEGINLSGSNFQHAVLRGSTFYFSDLSGSDFSGADLMDADFIESDLSGAIFDGANLEGVFISSDTNIQGIHWGEIDYDFFMAYGGQPYFDETDGTYTVRCPVIDPEGGLIGHWESTPDHHDCIYIEP